MDSNTTPDPVNRWATEHYGFDDEPSRSAPAAHAARPQPRVDRPFPRPRRRSALLAGGVLSVLLGAAGVGGIAMAANAVDDGPGDGGRGRFVTGDDLVDRFDDDVRGSGGADVGDFGGSNGGRG